MMLQHAIPGYGEGNQDMFHPKKHFMNLYFKTHNAMLGSRRL